MFANLQDDVVNSVNDGKKDKRRFVDAVIQYLFLVTLIVRLWLLDSAMGRHQKASKEGQSISVPALTALHKQGQSRVVECAVGFDVILNPLLSTRSVQKG